MNLEDKERTLCEIWCRCMGYFRPVSHYNIGKKQEFKDRKWFKESSANNRQKGKQEKISA